MNTIRELRKKLNLTQTEFAEKVGVTMHTVQNWENGRATPPISMYELIAAAFGVSKNWLLTGEGESFNSAGNRLSGARPMTGGDFSDFILIPQYNVEAAAGGGVIIHDEGIADMLAFQRKWVNTLPYPMSSLSLLTIRGDSMEPTYKDRDIVMITNDINVFHPGVYVIRDYLGLRVKRLDKDRQGNLRVISDNSYYKEELYTADDLAAGEVEIIGRVIWYGRAV